MAEIEESKDKPILQTESEGGGSGRPPRKTALGYAGFDDEEKSILSRRNNFGESVSLAAQLVHLGIIKRDLHRHCEFC